MKDDPLNRTKVKRGSQLPQSKLTESDIELIRLILHEREIMKNQLKQITNKSLAEKFGVHQRTIDKVVVGESWVHV